MIHALPGRLVRRPAYAALLAATLAGAAACGDDDTVTDPSANQARVKVVHAIANAGTVSVLVDNATVANGFTFRSVFPTVADASSPLYANVDAGARRLRVNLASGATAIDQTATLVAGTNYTAIAAGTAGGAGTFAPALILLTDDVSAPAAGTFRLRVVHGAAAVPAVDVHVAPGTAAPYTFTRAFQGVQFRQAGTASPTAGAYTACVTLAGTAPTAAGGNCAILAPLGAVSAGTAVTVIARDAAAGESGPGVIVTTDRRP